MDLVFASPNISPFPKAGFTDQERQSAVNTGRVFGHPCSPNQAPCVGDTIKTCFPWQSADEDVDMWRWYDGKVVDVDSFDPLTFTVKYRDGKTIRDRLSLPWAFVRLGCTHQLKRTRSAPTVGERRSKRVKLSTAEAVAPFGKELKTRLLWKKFHLTEGDAWFLARVVEYAQYAVAMHVHKLRYIFDDDMEEVQLHLLPVDEYILVPRDAESDPSSCLPNDCVQIHAACFRIMNAEEAAASAAVELQAFAAIGSAPNAALDAAPPAPALDAAASDLSDGSGTFSSIGVPLASTRLRESARESVDSSTSTRDMNAMETLSDVASSSRRAMEMTVEDYLTWVEGKLSVQLSSAPTLVAKLDMALSMIVSVDTSSLTFKQKLDRLRKDYPYE